MKSRFVIVGAGNTAHFFASALVKSGHHLIQILGRNKDSGERLSALYNCRFESDLDKIELNADFCLLATSDDSLSDLAIKIRKKYKGILVHCSGSCPLSDLESGMKLPHGVIYPLQSISLQDLPKPDHVPLLIEADNDQTLSFIESLALDLGSEVRKINSEQRLKLHLAAVIVCNFSNHLFLKAEQIVAASGLEFPILHPLISETIRKALTNGPYTSQTGPARRNDILTMQKHLDILKSDDELLILYKLISDSIQHSYS